jgi:hypothetical protein
MKLKTILSEGMYDRLVGQITKSILVTLNKMIDAGLTDKKYKGQVVRENPKGNLTVLGLLETSDVIEIGDFIDDKSGVSVTVMLKYKMTDGVREGDFYINGYADDTIWSELELLLATNPKDEKRILSKVTPYIRETIRHEIEHFTQRGDNLKASKFIRRNDAIRKKIRNNPDMGYKYLILPDEVDANIHGLYARAKTTKQPYQTVVEDYLNSFVKQGDITEKQKDIVYKAWKARIPKIGGIPKLK